MKSRITSILFLSLILSLFAACGNQPAGPDGPGGDDKNPPDNSSSICASANKPERCNKDPENFTFSRATYIDNMEFPKESSVDGHPNGFGASMGLAKDNDILDINAEVRKTIEDGKLNLIAEFDGWSTSEQEPPTGNFTLMMWTAKDKPTADNVKVQFASGMGTVSSAYFANARITKSGSTLKLTTGENTFKLPVDAAGIKLTAVMKKAKFEATVKVTGDGVTLENGIIYGSLTKKSIIEGLVKSEKACGTTCIAEVSENGETCKPAATDANCAVGGCKSLHKTCSKQEGISLAFLKQLDGEQVADAVVKVSGIPVKITK